MSARHPTEMELFYGPRNYARRDGLVNKDPLIPGNVQFDYAAIEE
jgi:hypothetical protein